MRGQPRLTSVVKAGVRRAGGRRLTELRRSRHAPTLSVVMPVYNVAEYLPAALDSALSQTLTDLEVIAVDDGSTDGCAEILSAYAARDFRVRVLTQANAGQGSARNLGVAHARGEFLTFLDSDDVVPADAYGAMVDGLRSSGSDFSVGNLRRLRHGELQRIIWSRTVHREDRIATTIEQFPTAMQDIIACNRMFRTAFWREQVGSFRGGIAYEDHVPMLTAYVRARTFDVLQRVTYHWRIREDLTSTGQQKARIRNLRDRIEVKQEAYDLLAAEASQAVLAAWVGRTLEVDFPPFLPFALSGDEEYRSLLAATYRDYLARATPLALSQVRVAMRLRAHLAAQERWEDLFAADDWLREVQNMPPTRVEDGRLVADFPPECTWSSALPPDQREMSLPESHFEGAVEHLEWVDDTLRITGWAWVRGLDMRSPGVRAWLVSPQGEVPLAVQQVRLPEADQWGPLSFASPADGGFVATVEAGSLTPGRWALRVEVSQEGLVAAGSLHGRVPRSAAVRPSSGRVGRLGVATEWDGATGLTLVVTTDLPGDAAESDRVALEDVRLGADGLELLVAGPPEQLTGAELVGGEVTIPLADPPVADDGRTRLLFATTVPDLDGRARPAPSGTYWLRLPGQRPVHASLGRSLAGRSPVHLLGQDHRVQVGQRPDGRAVLLLGPPLRDDEVGTSNRHRLRQELRRSVTAASGATAGVLLGAGGEADGDQWAMDQWLAEHRPELPRWWGVGDRSAVVPEGATALLRDSREWYAALATARFLSCGTDLGTSHVRGPAQRHLRTFPGHPFEPMGVPAWRRAGLHEHFVDREVAHVNAEWDCLLAPSEESVAVLREQFRFEGEVLVAGSPRTDPVVTADRDAARRRVRSRLGLPDDEVLVLHAPSARDEYDVAGPGGREGLDVAGLSAALGPGHTVLLRTDPRDRRPRPRVRDLPGVVDVGDRPDLTELLVALDVAVLDYSSLRFDVALAGVPMVFHVPDLEPWLRFRQPSFAWEETSPGPWARSLDEVVDRVREHGRLASAYAVEVGAFNARFNALNDGHATERVLRHFLP